jgi:nicotinate-nucleotide pyrophosphorylase (carboxylating)
MWEEEVQEVVWLALKEDIGSGDITTDLTIDPASESRAEIVCKDEQTITICGHLPAMLAFEELDGDCEYEEIMADGSPAKRGQTVAKIYGKTKAILTAERVALNFLSHLSGIATKAKEFSQKTKLPVYDTRKTVPGLRILQKYAVRCGGLHNHRMGLYDGIMIKDNHIRAVGSIEKAVKRAKEGASPTVKIEVEAQSLEQVREALSAGADIIMLDNMKRKEMEQAVALIKGKALVEVSGNVTLENLPDYEDLGIDFISSGALTHSVRAVNFSLEFGDIK